MNEEDIVSTEPLFTSKQQGLLRTKIEAGTETKYLLVVVV